MWDFNWPATTHSISLETNPRFDTGRKFLYSAGSNVCFLIRGLTKAFFIDWGNSPDVSDRFTIWVIVGNSSFLHCFTMLVGMGSRAQVALEADVIIFSTCSRDTSEKSEKMLSLSSGSNSGKSTGRSLACTSRSCLIRVIFWTK